MTIASQTSRISYTGDGATTAFAVPFYFLANADLVVSVQDTSGNVTTKVLGTDYNLSGATVSAGGTCTFTTAPAIGIILAIYRVPPITQTTSYNNNDPFPAKSHELALDKTATIDQYLRDQVNRAILVAPTDTPPMTTLPPASVRALKNLSFDAAGNPTASSSATGAAVSTVMAPVVAASTLAIARLALGSDFTPVTIQTGTTILAAHDHQVWGLGGGFFGVAINAASGYDPNFRIKLVNTDATRAKRVTVNGVSSSFFLWPFQSVEIFNVANNWQLSPPPQRWKIPRNTVVYVDAINGDDANDGLAPGAGNAVRTLHQALRVNAKDCFDLSGYSSIPIALLTVQLADNGSNGVAGTNAYSLAHLAFTPVGAEGRCTILIQGNATTPSNTILADAGGAAIGAYGSINIEVRNLQVGQTGTAAPIAFCGLEAADGGNVRCEGGVIFGTASAGQIQVSNGGAIDFDGAFSIVGGAQYWAQSTTGGRINTSGFACTISNTPAYSGQFAAAFEQSQIVTQGTVWTGSATGIQYFARNLSLIFTNNTTLPGSSAGSHDTTSFVG